MPLDLERSFSNIVLLIILLKVVSYILIGLSFFQGLAEVMLLLQSRKVDICGHIDLSFTISLLSSL